MKQVSHSPAQTHELARTFVSGLSRADSGATVVALSGDLGAGKTTFMQGVARALGVEDAVTSPTFVFEKIYRLSGQRFNHLVHIDAYRLEGSEELRELGWKELVAAPDNLVCIEWAERVAPALPEGARHLKFTFINDTTREIEIE